MNSSITTMEDMIMPGSANHAHWASEPCSDWVSMKGWAAAFTCKPSLLPTLLFVLICSCPAELLLITSTTRVGSAGTMRTTFPPPTLMNVSLGLSK